MGCGGCYIIAGVGAHVWYSSVLVTYAATMVYFVDSDTLSTVSSSLEYPTMTGTPITTENVTEVLILPTVKTNTTVQPPTTRSFLSTAQGTVEYTLLNNLINAQE